MGLDSRSYIRSYSGGGGLPSGVRGLLIANIALFVLTTLAGGVFGEALRLLELYPVFVVKRLFLWQLATYMFMHGGVSHILFNMLALWMFGKELEIAWGTRRFLTFYFYCGIGAGICVVVLNYLFADPYVPTLGSSGAIYGILAASAALWPDRQILYSFLFPIQMKYFVLIIGAVSFFGSLNLNSGVSDIAHLSGLIFGYILAQRVAPHRSSLGLPLKTRIRHAYRDWKFERNKRKFQVYLNKERSRGGRGPIH